MERADAFSKPISAADRSWTGARIAALAIGTFLVLVSLALLGGGGTALWADRTQRDDGYVTSDVHEFSTSGAALATEPTQLGAAGVGWLYSPGVLGKVRIRVTPASADRPVFVGIGRSDDVDRYLAGVERTVISGFFEDTTEFVSGGPARSDPRAADVWAASSTGAGERTVLWKPTNGSWTVVVMNADARPGLAVRADLGARMPPALWLAIGFLAGGAVLLAGGALLVVGAIRRRPSSAAPAV